MQVSIKWLKDYIDFDLSPEELADKLTMAGVPVENIHRAGEGIEKVVTGKIVKIEPHPNADKLCVCTLDVAAGEPIVIITGATNVREGQVVPVALVGAKLPNGLKISKGKLRGVASCGMLCSAEELKLDLEKLPAAAKDGIYILPSATPLGLDIKEVLGLDEVILEFELTANRADCFSVLGLAREIAALTGNSVKKPLIHVREDAGQKAADLVTVKIEAPEYCARFSTRVLKDVRIGPSPDWLKERVESAGIRSISNVVDVTNFVMVELGQPMHAYDYDMLAGHTLVARRARPGEKLTTLDGNQRETTSETLVISDAVQAAGLGGVMGGLATEVTESTQTVVLEAAAFHGVNIRRTARACGLHSEASGRFERGVDITTTQRALDRAAQLLQEMGACTVCEGVVEAYPRFVTARTIQCTAEQINRHLGTQISQKEMLDILRRLEFETNVHADEIAVTVPSWRNDVQYTEDLSEEIARIHGYDNISSTVPHGTLMQGGQSDKAAFIDRAKAILSGLGLYEAVSFSFAHPRVFDQLLLPAGDALRRAVPLLNPITDDFSILRTTLAGSMLEAVARNLSRKNEDVQLYEIGSVFHPKALPVTQQPDEPQILAGALTGRRDALGWNQDKSPVDFYDAKGIVEVLLEKLGVAKYTVETGQHYALHPGKTALFKKGLETIACVGEVHPQVLENFGIAKPVYYFEAAVDTLMQYASETVKYQPLPKYPAVSRDLALLVDAELRASDIEKTIRKSGGALLKEAYLFDVYTGKQVADGQKSLAFSLLFQSGEKTLTDDEVDQAYQRVLAALEKTHNAKLRA